MEGDWLAHGSDKKAGDMGSKEDLEPRQIQGSRKQLSQGSCQGLAARMRSTGHPEGVPIWSHFGPVWSRDHHGRGSAGHLDLRQIGRAHV